MTAFGLDGRVVVRAARCRTRRGDRAAVRDALERLDPDTGLPRSAILVVRRLQGTLAGNPPRLDGVALRPVVAAAHRASATPPPAESEAVLFADEADLLASLCRDVADRRPLGWWWTALLGQASASSPLAPAGAVGAAFDRFPRALPAAAAAAPDAVAAAAARLPVAEILRAAGAMAHAHGARAIADALRPVWERAVAAGAGPPVPGVGSGARAAAPASPAGGRSGRGDVRAAASPMAALLVDTALQLHQDPVGARSAAAAESLAARLAAMEASTGPGGGAALGRPRRSSVPPGARGSDRARSRVAGPAPGSAIAGGESGGSGATVGGRAAGERRAPPPPPTGPSIDDRPAGTIEPAAPPAPDGEAVETRLGGAFYLLNLLEHLDLPDSAGGPGEPGELVTRWGVLALVLRRWPEPGPRHQDPLFGLLDGLAWPARPEGARPPDGPWAYRSPAIGGLEPGAGSLHWWRDDDGGRLVLYDPALLTDPSTRGAAVLADLPAPADPADDEAVLRDEVASSLVGRPATPRRSFPARFAAHGVSPPRPGSAGPSSSLLASDESDSPRTRRAPSDTPPASAARGPGDRHAALAGQVEQADGGDGRSLPLAPEALAGLSRRIPARGLRRVPAPEVPDPPAQRASAAGLRRVPAPGVPGALRSESSAASTTPAGAARWGARVAQLLQALLVRRGLGPDVVRVSARVVDTGFAVRVHMALDDVDLDVRRAGLDRDPGWVPALGRVVELVYA